MKNRTASVDYAPISQIDWARLAAFIDGEGCILIAHNTQKNGRVCPYIRVVITNTDPRLIRWLRGTFGGAVMRGKMHSAKHRQVFKWAVSTRQAEELLLRCRQFLITKGDQADIAIAFQQTLQGFRRGNPLPQHIVDLRDEYQRQMVAARWQQHPIDDLMSRKATTH